MTPRWSGRATVTAVLDGAGARRISPTGGAALPGGTTADVTFSTDTTKIAGAVASTLRHGAGTSSRTRGPERRRRADRPPGPHLPRARRRVVRARQVRRGRHVADVALAAERGADGVAGRGRPGMAAAARASRPRVEDAVAQRHRRRRAPRAAGLGARQPLRAAGERAPGPGLQHGARRPEQRQLRRADLLGRRDLDVPRPPAAAPGHRALDAGVPLQDDERRPGQRRAARLPGPLLPVDERQRGRPPLGVPQRRSAPLPDAGPPAGRHRPGRLALLPGDEGRRLAAQPRAGPC